MRVNSLVAEKEKKGKDYKAFIFIAIVIAFVVAFFLDILAKVFVIIIKFLIEHWYYAIGVLLVLLFLRRIKRKKKKK